MMTVVWLLTCVCLSSVHPCMGMYRSSRIYVGHLASVYRDLLTYEPSVSLLLFGSVWVGSQLEANREQNETISSSCRAGR
jgi:hypothetical protein